MAPNIKPSPEEHLVQEFEKPVAPQANPRKYQLIYTNVVTFTDGHLAAIYGLYLCFTSTKWAPIAFEYVLLVLSEIGVTAGAHRLWAHRTYKAKWPLQIILVIFNSIAFQNTAIHWVRDHRLHHKYSDTDADPHNATRGFFFSHIGWLLVMKNVEVHKSGKQLDLSDIYNNPVLQFQKRYAVPFIGLVCFVLPTVIPMYFWGETLNNSWHIAMLRYALNLHLTFLVNSAAHYWGTKPYGQIYDTNSEYNRSPIDLR